MWQRYKGLKVFDRRQRQALTPHSSFRKFADKSRRSSFSVINYDTACKRA
jgi:hypothetical protein